MSDSVQYSTCSIIDSLTAGLLCTNKWTSRPVRNKYLLSLRKTLAPKLVYPLPLSYTCTLHPWFNLLEQNNVFKIYFEWNCNPIHVKPTKLTTKILNMIPAWNIKCSTTANYFTDSMLHVTKLISHVTQSHRRQAWRSAWASLRLLPQPNLQ
jgi:hypothetical protein